jgi:Cu2+-exporting ATPase
MAIQQKPTTIDPNNSSMVCYHCGSKVSFSEAIAEQFTDKTEIFCCVGCLSVAKLIHKQGLDIFYARREQKDFLEIVLISVTKALRINA